MSAGHTISWSIQPHKKSLNFGIFKHPGGSLAANIQTLNTVEDSSQPSTSDVDSIAANRDKSNPPSRNDNTKVLDILQSKGLKTVSWFGKCEADKVSMGKYDVADGEGGMYGLVFDNTFSKQVSKTATFVLMTYPTATPPKSGNNLLPSQSLGQRGVSTSSAGSKMSPGLKAVAVESTESLPRDLAKPRQPSDGRPRSGQSNLGNATMFAGILLKKRRKRNQGFAKRFFSLDFTSSTLSYYQSRQSSALRGAIPLSLAAISTNDKRREIDVDSGTELWHLRASSQKDFEAWREALERASQSAAIPATPVGKPHPSSPARKLDPAEEGEWNKVEGLVGRVAGIRDAVRRLAKDTDPKYLPSLSPLGISRGSNATSPAVSEAGESTEYFGQESTSAPERLPFWKRKPNKEASPSSLFRRSVSAQLAVPSPSSIPYMPPNGQFSLPKRQHRAVNEHTEAEEGVHDHCMAILRDLDIVVAEFSHLVSESRTRRHPPLLRSSSRQSTDSMSDDEFFDAFDGEPGRLSRSQTFIIQRDSEESEDEQAEDISDGESNSSSEFSNVATPTFDRKARASSDLGMWPARPKTLTPLPFDQPIRRRKLVPPAKVNPPSLIGFLRKNVGKDLSTIAMPVSANEPTSLLQRSAEQLEYSELLDTAATTDDPTKRLLHIAAFAVSALSNSRVKERAIRKPFNPMLGETFELVREDKGFRLVSEKVSHRPVRLAIQAESEKWTFLQSPAPQQKFWGKSIEVNTDGRARVFLHAEVGEEVYSWTHATSFLRNIIAGEKYVEPVQNMTVVNESTGATAVCGFKAGGMFAGRSEEVTVQVLDEHGNAEATGLVGKWTSRLNYATNGADVGTTVWSAGQLVDNAPQRYGFTHFAASLNEITPVEDGHIPVTDCRLRPDQRATENGDLDRAEALKARLEERQRARRKVMEEHGAQWQPRWFTKVGTVNGEDGGEEIWRLRTGKDGYWEERAKGEWTAVTDVFSA